MTQIETVDIEETLVARSALYGLLQRVFSDVPDDDLARNESSAVMDQCFDVLRLAYGLEDRRSVAIGEVAARAQSDGTCMETDWTLEGEYTRLFVGVGKPAVCLWESICITGVNALFQPGTLAVRQFYASLGFEARDKGRVADDHMAIELAFMRELALAASRELNPRRMELLQAQCAFLAEHLSRWVDSFAEQVVASDKSGYYAGYARLLADFVACDGEFLAGITSGDS